MDKFLIREKPPIAEQSSSSGSNERDVTDVSEISVSSSDVARENVKSLTLEGKSAAVKNKIRKCSVEYLQFGFFWCGDEGNPKPVCLLCGSVLSNQSVLPNKLKRHLQANHSHSDSKPRAYFNAFWICKKKKKIFPRKLRNVFLFLTKL
jgi:hypothetical protein